MLPRLIRIWRIQWWCSFFFSVFIWKKIKKSKLFAKAEIWNLEKFEYVKFDSDFHFFSLLDWKYLFCINLAQKLKIVSLRWNFIPRLFRICQIRWWCSLFLSQMCFWKFCWKNPVGICCYLINLPIESWSQWPFLLQSKDERPQASNCCVRNLSLIWTPWLSVLVCNSKVFVQTVLCY